MTELLGSLADVVLIAHDIGLPHQEPMSQSDGGGGASPVVILGGVVASVGAVGGLVWLKKRTDNETQGGPVTDTPDKHLEEMEEQEKELDRHIEETEEQWESTQQEVPSADEDEDKPLDEENPVGGT